jgi:hypothetical protein
MAGARHRSGDDVGGKMLSRALVAYECGQGTRHSARNPRARRVGCPDEGRLSREERQAEVGGIAPLIVPWVSTRARIGQEPLGPPHQSERSGVLPVFSCWKGASRGESNPDDLIGTLTRPGHRTTGDLKIRECIGVRQLAVHHCLAFASALSAQTRKPCTLSHPCAGTCDLKGPLCLFRPYGCVWPRRLER